MENEERLAGWGLGESGSKPALFLGTKKGAAPNCRLEQNSGETARAGGGGIQMRVDRGDGVPATL